jgi:hypothetical protein
MPNSINMLHTGYWENDNEAEKNFGVIDAVITD